ncbi:cytochrome c [uncultured Meiothermus sp.]|jgi:mono/diheme cytochrome c family protein|uniref:c-type cytochrome n=1 Tax=uncultured Meiothermus sp. TaxID=157471 RepID=UPI0026179BAE|nr:cytochrome c [uncultured Meiothermus sp.]
MKHLLVAMILLTSAAFAQSGAALYQQCQGCHQPNGAGIRGVFPPLAGHVPEILAARGGRVWIIQMMLYGLSGEITVGGVRYMGVMPGYRHLSDADLAALLNHISTQWGNRFPTGQRPFTAAEVQAQRAKTMTAAQVNAARRALGLR